MLFQQPLPPQYRGRGEADLAAAIAARKAQLGKDLVILGHHYQQDEVIQFADFTGDSFKLSQLAAERVRESGAKYVVFCGVHFMAESADVLAPPGVAIVLPDLGAGCSMADMADYDQTVEAWNAINAVLSNSNFRGIPICYMNSTAAIKAFCGEHGGAVCTSSNCARVFEWALAGGTQPKAPGEQIKILFLPDEHLGRNTAVAMGHDIRSDMAVWDPKAADSLGGLEESQIERATFLLWKGHCSVHMLFKPEHVDEIRAEWPDVKVIVHPECTHEVVLKADMTGSTERIIKVIEQAPPGSRWSVGTEVHMVARLVKQAAKRNVHVRMLSGCQCLCTTMFRIDMPHLLWCLDNLAEGRIVNQITVPADMKRWALVALDRMLHLAAAPVPA